MLQLDNDTGMAASLFASPDEDGVDSLYTIVKGTFELTPGLPLAADQVEVTLAPLHYGEAGKTSIRVPSDIALAKPATDVLLVGTACAPGGRATWQMDVSLAVGPVAKTVRVSGDRVWETGPTGAAISWVTPFERMPLVWERAFGGVDQTDEGPVADARNPVGVGFHTRGGRPVAGSPLPNVEEPASPVTSWRDTPPPASFAPVASHWEPRRSYAGTYDERWQRSRAPLLPSDFDARFLQLAPSGLVASGYLQGGERVEVRGTTPDGNLSFALPRVALDVTFVLDSRRIPRPAPLDTVLIESDQGRVVLVWRAALACDKKLLRVREVIVRAQRAS